jgi:ABC-type microcin C transport system permease subunit YejE
MLVQVVMPQHCDLAEGRFHVIAVLVTACLRTEFAWCLSIVLLLLIWTVLLDVVMHQTLRQANATDVLSHCLAKV